MNYVKLGWAVRHALEVALIVWIGFKASIPVTIFCALVLIRFMLEDWIKTRSLQRSKELIDQFGKSLADIDLLKEPHGPSH